MKNKLVSAVVVCLLLLNIVNVIDIMPGDAMAATASGTMLVGNVSSDGGDWTLAGSPYTVVGTGSKDSPNTISILSYVTLTIEAGVEICVPEGKTLLILGNVVIDGGVNDPVYFTGSARSLNGNQETAAGGKVIFARPGGVMDTRMSLIDGAVFVNTSVELQGTNTYLRNSVIKMYAGPGDALTVNGTNNVIDNCYVDGNMSGGVSFGGEYNEVNGLVVNGNGKSKAAGVNTYGMALTGSNNTFKDCTFSNNGGVGLDVTPKLDTTVYGNGFTNCTMQANTLGGVNLMASERRSVDGLTITGASVMSNYGAGLNITSGPEPDESGEVIDNGIVPSQAYIRNVYITESSFYGNDYNLDVDSGVGTDTTAYYNNLFCSPRHYNVRTRNELVLTGNSWGLMDKAVLRTTFEPNSLDKIIFTYSEYEDIQFFLGDMFAVELSVAGGVLYGDTDISVKPIISDRDAYTSVVCYIDGALVVDETVVIKKSSTLSVVTTCNGMAPVERSYTYKVVTVVPSIEPGFQENILNVTLEPSEKGFTVLYVLDNADKFPSDTFNVKRPVQVYKTTTIYTALKEGNSTVSKKATAFEYIMNTDFGIYPSHDPNYFDNSNPFELELTTDTDKEGYLLYYNIDYNVTGELPDITRSKTLYEGNIQIYKTARVQAALFSPDGKTIVSASPVVWVYEMPSPVITFEVVGSGIDVKIIDLSCSMSGFDIRYTMNGGVPAMSSPLYSEETKITFYETGTLRAVCVWGREIIASSSMEPYTVEVGIPSVSSSASYNIDGSDPLPEKNGNTDVTYTDMIYVFLESSVSGFDIYYTVQRSGTADVYTDPTSPKALLYDPAKPVEIYRNSTIWAVCRVEREEYGGIYTRKFTINEPDIVADPDPKAGGVIYNEANVTLRIPNPEFPNDPGKDNKNYQIYYSINNSNITELYTPGQQIKIIQNNSTLRTVIARNGDLLTDVIPFTYDNIRGSSNPIEATASEIDNYSFERQITLNIQSPYVLYYTTDGSSPSITPKLKYTGPFFVYKSTLVRAVIGLPTETGSVLPTDSKIHDFNFELESPHVEAVPAPNGIICDDTHPEVSMSKTPAPGLQTVRLRPDALVEGDYCVYYTVSNDGLDAPDPRTSKEAILYKEAFTVYEDSVIKAAVARKKIGTTPEDRFGTVCTFTYYVDQPDITLNPPPGELDGPTNVLYQLDYDGISACYTTEDTSAYTTYKEAEAGGIKWEKFPAAGLEVYKNGMTVSVIPARGDDKYGDIQRFTYTMPMPVIKATELVNGNTKLSITPSKFTIYYTLDGTDPVTSATGVAYSPSSGKNIFIYRSATMRACAVYKIGTVTDKFGEAIQPDKSLIFDVPIPTVSLTSDSTPPNPQPNTEDNPVYLTTPKLRFNGYPTSTSYKTYYTTDENMEKADFKEASTAYIYALNKTTKIRAYVGYKLSNGVDRFGEIQTFEYNIEYPDIVISPEPGSYTADVTRVKLSMLGKGNPKDTFTNYKIYYTADGTMPTLKSEDAVSIGTITKSETFTAVLGTKTDSTVLIPRIFPETKTVFKYVLPRDTVIASQPAGIYYGPVAELTLRAENTLAKYRVEYALNDDTVFTEYISNAKNPNDNTKPLTIDKTTVVRARVFTGTGSKRTSEGSICEFVYIIKDPSEEQKPPEGNTTIAKEALTIRQVTFLDEEGLPGGSPMSGPVSTANVSIWSSMKDDVKDAAVIAAYYDSAGPGRRLISMGYTPGVSFNKAVYGADGKWVMGQGDPVRVSVPMDTDKKVAYVQIMIWNNISGLKKLGNPYEIEFP